MQQEGEQKSITIIHEIDVLLLLPSEPFDTHKITINHRPTDHKII